MSQIQIPADLPEKLKELIGKLAKTTGLNDSFQQALAVLSQTDFTRSDLTSYIRFSEVRYQRNLIFRCAEFEILLMCWNPGQITAVHNHRGSWCGAKVIEGKSTEVTFQKSALGRWIPSAVTKIKTGEVLSSFDQDTHIQGNFEEQELLTLHCYVPPLDKYEIIPSDRTIIKSFEDIYKALQPTSPE